MKRHHLAFLFILVWVHFISAQSRDTIFEVAANPEAGFHYPFFIFIPAGVSKTVSTYLLVEPNDTGLANDTFTIHEKSAKTQASLGPLGHYLSGQLHVPLLIPVFPKPEKKWKLNPQRLDRDAMKIKHGPMKRIDLQLVAMIEDGKKELKKLGYQMQNQILLSGFSSSGVFANRFAWLHPEVVKAYAAGGIHGWLIMPFAKWNDQALPYPVGTADFKKLTGGVFNFEAFRKVHQFLYMGEADEKDAVLMEEGYSKKEKGLIFASFGEQMQPDRWFACQLQYKVATHDAQFRTYSGVGHEINADILRDLVRFYSVVIKG